MSKTLAKTASADWFIPSVSQPVRWGLGVMVPLLLTLWILHRQLSGLPSGAWHWEIDWGWLALVALLVPVNWTLEILKWAELLPYGRMARRSREVLYGTAWSLIGPLRMGAVVGRVAAVRKTERMHAVRAFATGSAAQWWCTITGAGIALAVEGLPTVALPVFAVSGITLGLFFGWSPGFWKRIRKSNIMGDWGLARRIPKVRRRRALTLSIARYLVMLAQFVMALQAFHHLGHWMWMDQMIHQATGGALTWGLTSLAPIPLLGDLGLREAAALLALPSPNPADATAIVGATLTLWLLNLILPAMWGLILHSRALRNKARRANLPV